MPPALAVVGGIASAIGGAAAGTAGLIGAVGSAGLSALGGVASGAAGLASGIVGTGASVLGGIVSGAGSLLFGKELTTAEQMALEAEPGYYDTAGRGILASLPAAASKTIDYLGKLAPSALGIYQTFSRPEAEIPAKAGAVPLTKAQIQARAIPSMPTWAIPSITAKALPSVSIPTITKSALPVLGAQTPVYMRTGTPAPAAIPNYLIYIGLAILALFLLMKK